MARGDSLLCPLSLTQKSNAGAARGAIDRSQAAGLRPDLPGWQDIRLFATGIIVGCGLQEDGLCFGRSS